MLQGSLALGGPVSSNEDLIRNNNVKILQYCDEIRWCDLCCCFILRLCRCMEHVARFGCFVVTAGRADIINHICSRKTWAVMVSLTLLILLLPCGKVDRTFQTTCPSNIAQKSDLILRVTHSEFVRCGSRRALKQKMRAISLLFRCRYGIVGAPSKKGRLWHFYSGVMLNVLQRFFVSHWKVTFRRGDKMTSHEILAKFNQNLKNDCSGLTMIRWMRRKTTMTSFIK